MTTPLPVATGRESLRYVWNISRPYRGRLLLVLLLGIVSATAGLVAPLAIGVLVDAAQDSTASAWTVAWMVAIMVVAAVLGAIGAATTIVVAARVYHSILASLRERLVARALALPQSVVERAGTGDLISRTSDDVAQIADAAPSIIPAFTMTAFTLSVTVAGMAAVDWWYGVALVALLPLYIVTVRWYLRTAPAIYQAERAAMSTRAQQLVESQRGHDTIAGLDLSENRHTRVLAASWGVVGFALKTRTVQNMFFGRLNLAEYVGLSAILVVGFVALSGGQTTVGAVTAAVLLFMRLFGPINQFLLVFDTLQSVAASLNRMVGVVTAPVPETVRATTSSIREGDAVLADRVTFAYDDAAPVLHDVTLAVPFGNRVAIVGASGAGKTTLASVVAGTHPPTHGSITRPEHTVVVTQETHVFSGSVTDNLLLARPDATETDVRRALELAIAAHWDRTLPQGLETKVGHGGLSLTSAQAQQLALARLALADPELAILDEATAEADSAEAGLLDEAAHRATQGRTALVIAHRLSQAAACDHIVVMDRGRVIEQGDHDSLRKSGGVYAQLWEAWSAPRSLPPDA